MRRSEEDKLKWERKEALSTIKDFAGGLNQQIRDEVADAKNVYELDRIRWKYINASIDNIKK